MIVAGPKQLEISSLRQKHKNVLIIVLVINAVLFRSVEAAAGLFAHSTALLADSLDMLGDSLVYGFSLYVLSRSAEWKAKAALLKGAIMAVFGDRCSLGSSATRRYLGSCPAPRRWESWSASFSR